MVWRAASSTAESEGVGQALPLPSLLPLPLVSTNSSGGVCDSFTDRESGLCHFLSFFRFFSLSLITPIQLEQTERESAAKQHKWRTCSFSVCGTLLPRAHLSARGGGGGGKGAHGRVAGSCETTRWFDHSMLRPSIWARISRSFNTDSLYSFGICSPRSS